MTTDGGAEGPDRAPGRAHARTSRRALLGGGVGLGLAGLLAACTSGTPKPSGSPTGSPTGNGATSSAGPTASSTPGGPASWQALAAAVSGRLLRPGSQGWDSARVLESSADPEAMTVTYVIEYQGAGGSQTDEVTLTLVEAGDSFKIADEV